MKSFRVIVLAACITGCTGPAAAVLLSGCLFESGADASHSPSLPKCCKICKKSKACGDSCIPRSKVCRKPPGCACNG